jgi:wyosine [tRNA(Phe)-imidazoG37] synthetase (radical SAM superfamily)
VSLKVDSVEPDVWRRINQPCEGLELERILSGIAAFAEDFSGTLATESMLLEGINTGQEQAERLANFLQRLAPDRVSLSIPTRPTADGSVRAAGGEAPNRIYQTVSRIGLSVELLTGYEGDAFASTGNFIEDLLAITAVHPLRKDAVLKLLGKTEQDWGAVQRLLEKGELREIEYQGHYFYLRSLPV